jgi:uncharacterized protein Smg (DUF494 family)
MIYERIIEIILYLLNVLKSNKMFEEEDMQKLIKLGYSENEINAAFSWIYSKFYTNKKLFESNNPNSDSKRFLNSTEQNIITPEAYGYLIQLNEMGLIDNTDIDLILERILATNYNYIDKEDMKSITASYIIDIEEMNNSNKRTILNINDTVN